MVIPNHIYNIIWFKLHLRGAAYVNVAVDYNVDVSVSVAFGLYFVLLTRLFYRSTKQK